MSDVITLLLASLLIFVSLVIRPENERPLP
jgi:hypothetical protein